MEKRFVVFILICFIAIPLYFRVLGPREEPVDPAGTPGGGTSTESTPAPGISRESTPRPPENTGGPDAPRNDSDPRPSGDRTGSGENGDGAPSSLFEEKTFTVGNDVLELELTSVGAGITRAVLPEYREEDRESSLTLFSPDLLSGTALTLDLPGHEVDLRTVSWEVVGEELGGRRITFRYPLPEGRAITKTIELASEGYEVTVEVRASGIAPGEAPFRYRLLGPDRLRFDLRSRYGNQRVLGMFSPRGEFADTEHQSLGPLAQRERIDQRPVLWGGLESNYFAFVIIPDRDSDVSTAKMVEIAEQDRSRSDEYKGHHERGLQEYPYRVGFQQEFGVERTDRFVIFLGPKDRTVLEKYDDYGFAELIDYGSLGLLVRLFLFLLRSFESMISSWGVAIILLTVLVKALLHPVNKRNQRTMQRQQKKMAKIQPEIKALREKHKNDSLKANQEIQALFREHGVNPAQMFGGCLMIFLQLPIWIGLIKTFNVAIELRQASFLYISDLTAPDNFFQLPFSFPITGWTYFNLLPVLYVLVTLINQRMMPRSDDPQMQQQQKMMTFMMVAFGFIFYNFPSGLLVYFLTSASLGILEQRIIRAELKHEEAKAADSPKPETGPPGGTMRKRKT